MKSIAVNSWTDNTSDVSDEVSELRLIAAGDQDTFEKLYVRYHPKLYRFVQGLLSNPEQIEEVVSDTLYAVWKGAQKFQNKSKVSTWIFGIAFRTAMKSIRSGAKHARFTDGSEDTDVLMDQNISNDPAVGTSISEEASKLMAALELISPEQRAVVELAALGWSSLEIGEIIDCPSNTVKTRMFSARRKLKQLLGVE